MDKKDKKQSRIEKKIPPVLSGGKAFSALAESSKKEHQQYKSKYRKRLYEIMDELLGDNAPKNTSSYRQYFSNPEKNVRDAFLKNKFRDEKKYEMVIGAMEMAITQVIGEAVKDSRELMLFYRDRERKLITHLKKYMDSHE